MAFKSEKTLELYELLQKKGYERPFCDLICREMNTDWTAGRMLGYLRQVPRVREEELVDEMLAILSDRDRIREKKEMEFYQGKMNDYYRNRPEED